MMALKKSAGPVTADERRRAELQDRDRARLQRIGVAESIKIGNRVQRAVLRSAGNIPKAIEALRRELLAMAPVVRQGMVAAYLAGRNRSRLTRPKGRPLSLSNGPGVYDKAIETLETRLALTPKTLIKLEVQYEAAAIRVVKKATDAIERKLQESVAESIRVGAHVREGKASLREAFAKAGMTPNNSFTLEAIFRTQTQQAYSAARFQASQDPVIQDILWGFKYVTVGDDRVRDEHVGFDGVTLPKSDPFWITHWPPNGWACRCAVIEIFEPRKIVKVPAVVEVDGKEVKPEVDKGFRFNPGEVFALPL
jgi:SPP1 gp7 family putative phage head morphogenesis protein